MQALAICTIGFQNFALLNMENLSHFICNFQLLQNYSVKEHNCLEHKNVE